MGYVRSVSEGVSEIKIDYEKGYRFYFTKRGQTAIFLLCGGDKGSDVYFGLKWHTLGIMMPAQAIK